METFRQIKGEKKKNNFCDFSSKTAQLQKLRNRRKKREIDITIML